MLSSCDIPTGRVVFEEQPSGGTTVTKTVSQSAPAQSSSGQSSSDEESGTTFVGATVVDIPTRSGSSGSSRDRDDDGELSVDVTDQVVLKDSGLNNNLVDLFAFTSDPRAVLNQLTYTLDAQSNTQVVQCVIDFGRYVDCTPGSGQIGFSQITLSVSDDSELYTDVFIVTVAGEVSVQESDGNDEQQSTQNESNQGDSSNNQTQDDQQENQGSNVAPTLNVVSDQTATVGTVFTLQISASDANGDSISFSDNSQLFVIGQNGLISFTPQPGQEGSSTVIITASDGKDSSSMFFSLTLQGAAPNPPVPDPDPDPPNQGSNNAPTISSISNQFLEVGTHFDFTVSASDPDGDTLTYSDNTGLFAINSNTGAISFIPQAGNVGNHPITVTVSDGDRSVATSFTMIISPASDPPPPPGGSSSPFGNVSPTFTWRSYLGSITIGGSQAEVGDEIGVFDADNVLAGKFVVAADGQYGFLHVYGDDATTSIDEGASAGDALTFKVWDKSADATHTASVSQTWQGDMERIQQNIAVS